MIRTVAKSAIRNEDKAGVRNSRFMNTPATAVEIDFGEFVS
jgi:hypothetical protein